MKEDFFDERAALFESYNQGKLEGKQKATFEKQLTEDVKFKSDYDNYIKSLILIESLGVRDMMKEVIGEKQKSVTLTFSIVVKLMVAAAILIVGIFFLKPSSTDNAELFKQNFTLYPNLYSSRTSGQKQKLSKALSYYQSDDFAAAVREFESIETINDTIRLYLGISKLALGNFSEAKQNLSPIDNQFLQEPKIWYLGLACLMVDQPDSVTYYLKNLTESKKYGEGAEQILNR